LLALSFDIYRAHEKRFFCYSVFKEQSQSVKLMCTIHYGVCQENFSLISFVLNFVRSCRSG